MREILMGAFRIMVNNSFKESFDGKMVNNPFKESFDGKRKNYVSKNTHNRLSILPYISLKYYFFINFFFIIFPNHLSL